MNTKLLIVFSILALIFISCKKSEEATVVINGSAKITGVAKCELDLTNTELEYVPVGTKIIATINTIDLVTAPNTSITYPDRSYTTTVGAHGVYTLNVEANTKNVTVNIVANDFEYNQIINDTTITRKIYSLAPSTVNVIDGVSKIRDVNFF